MRHYTLLEFNGLVKQTLKDQLAPSYWIVAEIGEVNFHGSGHCYLTLVEKQDNKDLAKIRGTIWSYTFAQIHDQFITATGLELQAGMSILMNASLEFHELYGLSINVRDIDPNYTLGEREKSRQQTIDKLKKNGLLDRSKELTLPQVLQNVAVISAETAAGYGDFMNQLAHNSYGYVVNTELFHASMQGTSAPESLKLALQNIILSHTVFDAIVVIRGGGSQTDLDCFDNYEWCAALAKSPVPVITGIGHERDSTISDLVAKTSLKTPTAVAEFLLSSFMHFESEMQLAFDQIHRTAQKRITASELILSQQWHLFKQKGIQALNSHEKRVDILKHQIEKGPNNILIQAHQQVELHDRILSGYNPSEILKRGFTLSKVNGRYLSKSSQVKPGSVIETEFQDGVVISNVESTRHE